MEYIATRWFQLQPSSHQRVLITDAVDFLSTAPSNHYHAIIHDACHSQPIPGYQLLCPARPFIDDHVLRDMRRLLTANGTLVVNTFAKWVNDSAVMGLANARRREIKRQFSEHFHYCYYANNNFNHVWRGLGGGNERREIILKKCLAPLMILKITDWIKHFIFDPIQSVYWVPTSSLASDLFSWALHSHSLCAPIFSY